MSKINFDKIISNPPYQQSDGVHGASAKTIYQHFIRKAKELNPKQMVFLIPSRWMAAGKGLDDFRKEMLNDKHIRVLHDYPLSRPFFPGTDIKGGVCCFLWDRDSEGLCNITTSRFGVDVKSKRYLKNRFHPSFIRHPEQLSVLEKLGKYESFASIVSARKPYGLCTDFFKDPAKYGLPPISKTPIDNGFRIYGLEPMQKRTVRYIPFDYPIPRGYNAIGKWKIFVPQAAGCAAIGEKPTQTVLGEPILGYPFDICTETYVSIGSFNTKDEALNCLSYIKTKFFRFLVGILKITQQSTRVVYSLVPMQDFSKGWTDNELYNKYKISRNERKFIDETVREHYK